MHRTDDSPPVLAWLRWKIISGGEFWQQTYDSQVSPPPSLFIQTIRYYGKETHLIFQSQELSINTIIIKIFLLRRV